MIVHYYCYYDHKMLSKPCNREPIDDVITAVGKDMIFAHGTP
jgi:hypothetical protein